MSSYTHIEKYIYIPVPLGFTEWGKWQEKFRVGNISAVKEKMKNLISKWQFNCTNMYGSESKERDIINECFERSTMRNTDLLKQRLNEKNPLPQNPGLCFVAIQR